MKKFISLVLVAVLMFSFAACNNNSETKEDSSNTTEQSTVELNAEELKYNWTDGVLTFSNGKQIALPCTVSQFAETSGLKIENFDVVGNDKLEPDESKDINLVGNDMCIGVECENLTTENINLMDATVVEYSFNNTRGGNVKIKFANTLTMGVYKADVEEALGEPNDTAGENTLYFYKGKNDKGKKIELRISFNSDNIVNSVAFKIDD